jgi:ATP-dependent DNA ligase
VLLRIHPAASRVEKLAAEHPALLVVFDLLVDPKGRSLIDAPLADRRAALEAFAARYLDDPGRFRLSPQTPDLATARGWLERTGPGLDGVVAKRADLHYQAGERGMQKVKRVRTADCVIGGYRCASKGDGIGSLLLGLYDDEGRLQYVGHTSGLTKQERLDFARKLARLKGPSPFTGRAPGGPSRWSQGRSTEWQPVRPELVVEVSYDHMTGGRFRHGAGYVRPRPDKLPSQCTFAQFGRRTRGTPLDLVA